MEWSIKSLSKKCAVGGECFVDGDVVVSLILKTPEGLFERADVLEKNLPMFSASGTVLGRWTRVFSSKALAREREAARLAAQESFFVSLYKSGPSEENALLKQLLALLLERRRVLKMKTETIEDPCVFVHSRTKAEFSVPMKKFSPEEIAVCGNILETLIQ